MAYTSAPTVKANLLAVLLADSNLLANQDPSTTPGAVQVTYGHSGSGQIQQEAIYFGRTIWDKEEAKALGMQRRDEYYHVEVVVDVSHDGNDPQETEERMWALVQRVEAAVRPPNPTAQATLSGACTWAVFGGVDHTPMVGDGSRVSVAVCRIDVFNRK